jgi:hypothetical protein
LFTILDAIKGVAVSSEWVEKIKEAAKIKYGSGKDGPTVTDMKITFDGTLVLLLVLPIRFANLKAVDITSVSSRP